MELIDELRMIDKGEEANPSTTIKQLSWTYNGAYTKKAVAEYKEKESHCANCGYEAVLDWHHILITHHDKPPMTNGELYQYCFGMIRLCPNCHCRIHRENKSKGNG